MNGDKRTFQRCVIEIRFRPRKKINKTAFNNSRTMISRIHLKTRPAVEESNNNNEFFVVVGVHGWRDGLTVIGHYRPTEKIIAPMNLRGYCRQ